MYHNVLKLEKRKANKNRCEQALNHSDYCIDIIYIACGLIIPSIFSLGGHAFNCFCFG